MAVPWSRPQHGQTLFQVPSACSYPCAVRGPFGLAPAASPAAVVLPSPGSAAAPSGSLTAGTVQVSNAATHRLLSVSRVRASSVSGSLARPAVAGASVQRAVSLARSAAPVQPPQVSSNGFSLPRSGCSITRLESAAAAHQSPRGTGSLPVHVATATASRILPSTGSGVNVSVVIPANVSQKAADAAPTNGYAGSPKRRVQAHERSVVQPAQVTLSSPAAPESDDLASFAPGEEEVSVSLAELPTNGPTSLAEACGAELLGLEEQPPSSAECRRSYPPAGGCSGGGGSVSSSPVPVRLDDAPDGQSSEQQPPGYSCVTASVGCALEQANALRSRCGAVEGIALRARGMLQQRARTEALRHPSADAERGSSGPIGSLAEGFLQTREETLMAQSMPGVGPLPSSSMLACSSAAGPLPPTPLSLAPTRSASAASCSALSVAAGMAGSASAMSMPGSAAAEMETGVDAEAVLSAFAAQAGSTQASSSSQASPSRSASRPRSPPRFKDLYGDALARRERQQARTASQLRQRKACEEQQHLQLQLQRVERQASYKGRQDFRTHEEREMDMVRRRQTWSQAHQSQQALREQQEMRECTFRPELRSQSRDRSSSVQGAGSTVGSSGATGRGSSVQGAGSTVGSSGATGRPSATTSRAESRARNGAACSRAGSTSHSPRRENHMMELRKLQEKQMAVLRQLGEICAGSAAEPPGGGGDPCDSPRDHLRRRSSQGAAKAGDGPEKLATELRLYRMQLQQVHALERLDMQALELPADKLQMLLTTGFRLGLAEGLRRKLKKPPNTAGAGSPEGGTAAAGAAPAPQLPCAARAEEVAGESNRLPQSAERDGTGAAPVLPAASFLPDCTDDELLSASSPS